MVGPKAEYFYDIVNTLKSFDYYFFSIYEGKQTCTMTVPERIKFIYSCQT